MCGFSGISPNISGQRYFSFQRKPDCAMAIPAHHAATLHDAVRVCVFENGDAAGSSSSSSLQALLFDLVARSWNSTSFTDVQVRRYVQAGSPKPAGHKPHPGLRMLPAFPGICPDVGTPQLQLPRYRSWQIKVRLFRDRRWRTSSERIVHRQQRRIRQAAFWAIFY